MSHDTHHGQTAENKAKISFGNSFWLVIILVGLFIAALNFVQAESGSEGHGDGHEPAHHEAQHHEATHNEATHHEAAPAHAAEATEEGSAPATEEAHETEEEHAEAH